MDRAEKIMLILKAKFNDNEDIINKIDAMAQLKRPEILLDRDEKFKFHQYAEEWHNKGWIIYNAPSLELLEKIYGDLKFKELCDYLRLNRDTYVRLNNVAGNG